MLSGLSDLACTDLCCIDQDESSIGCGGISVAVEVVHFAGKDGGFKVHALRQDRLRAGTDGCGIDQSPCAVCGIFGEYEFSGKLPVDIPEMDEAYQFTDKILYTKAID